MAVKHPYNIEVQIIVKPQSGATAASLLLWKLIGRGDTLAYTTEHKMLRWPASHLEAQSKPAPQKSLSHLGLYIF